MPKKTTLANKRKRLRITPITRKQALSYNMTATPNQAARANGMGVTAISAVNGKGAHGANYRRRYANTLAALLGSSSTPNPGDAMFYYRNARPKKAAQPKAAKPKAAKPKAAKPKAASPSRAKYARGKSPKQLANLLKGRQKLQSHACRPKPPKYFTEAGEPVKSGAKKAKANRRSGRQNGVASYISNVRRNVMSFSEWSNSMKANRRPHRSAAKKRKAKRNPLAQALANARRRRRARRNAPPGVRSIDVRAYSRGRLKKAASKKAAPKKAAPKKAASKKAASKKVASKKVASKKVASKKVASKKVASKKSLVKAKANRRRRAHRNLAQAAANRGRRHHRKAHRNLAQAAANRRRRHARRNGIASYISNIGVSEIMDVVKQGAIIGGGLIAHKVLTNLVSSNIDMLKGMKFGKSITGVAVAAVGIPAATMLVPGAVGKQLAVGMGAALVHTVLVDVLSNVGQSSIASMLGDYTEASAALPAAGYGSYYEFSPGEQYSGMGAYYEFSPGEQYSGMGEYIEQGASGFGAYGQAAAGFGSPILAQAAAGVGEYVVQGAEGIGEYEQVVPEYTAPAVTREGISPSLGSAEAALSIAEAAAGVGGFGNVDANLQQIVYPKGQSLDIKDDPGGSRSGLFFGGNGVFGP